MATTTRRSRTSGSTTRAAAKKAASTVIEIDFDDYEGDGNAYMGDDPRPGVYTFRLVNVEAHTAQNGNEGIRWTFECTDPAYAGWRGYMYTNMGTAKFKTQQIVKAVQGGQEKPVKLDLAKPDKFLASCKEVVGRVVNDQYETDDGEVRSSAKLLRVVAESAAPKRSRKPEPEDDEDDDFEDADDGFEDDDEEDFEDDDADEDDDAEDDEVDEDEAEDDEEDDEEEEPEPEPEPAPRRRRASTSAKATSTKKAAPARRSRR